MLISGINKNRRELIIKSKKVKSPRVRRRKLSVSSVCSESCCSSVEESSGGCESDPECESEIEIELENVEKKTVNKARLKLIINKKKTKAIVIDKSNDGNSEIPPYKPRRGLFKGRVSKYTPEIIQERGDMVHNYDGIIRYSY